MNELDYESKPLPAGPRPDGRFAVAYMLLAAPLAYSAFMPAPHPMPSEVAVGMYVCVGLAVGAAVFILRRRPRDAAGWLGLALWGGLCVIAVAHAMLGGG